MKFIVIYLISALSVVVTAEVNWNNVEMIPDNALRFIRKNDQIGRVINGTEAIPHSIPWQVALFITRADAKIAFCGGSLISRNYVLTAAHCLANANHVQVMMGAHSIRNSSETTHINLFTDQFEQHKDYDAKKLVNDIAYIKLPETINFTNEIQPVSLPPLSEKKNLYVDKIAMVSGWGKTSDLNAQISDILQRADLKIMTNIDCDIEYFGAIEKVHICGKGNNGQSSCNGDSGGPLVIKENGKAKLIGIVSFGVIFGCEAGWPSAFTRVTSYLDWIQEHTDVIIQN